MKKDNEQLELDLGEFLSGERLTQCANDRCGKMVPQGREYHMWGDVYCSRLCGVVDNIDKAEGWL